MADTENDNADSNAHNHNSNQPIVEPPSKRQRVARKQLFIPYTQFISIIPKLTTNLIPHY